MCLTSIQAHLTSIQALKKISILVVTNIFSSISFLNLYAIANDIFATVFYLCYFLIDSVINTSLENGSTVVVGKK